MRIRRSEGTIERYGVTLSPGLSVENEIIETLLMYPKGRRQQWLRKVLTQGLHNRHMTLPVVDTWSAPKDDPAPNKLVSIGLDRRAAEDMSILSLIEQLPFLRRSQALRMLLVLGMHAPAAVSKKPIPLFSNSTTPQENHFPQEEAGAVVATRFSVSTPSEDSSLGEPEIRRENASKTVSLALEARKVRDNPSEAVGLERPTRRSGSRLRAKENPVTAGANEVAVSPAVEMTISVLSNPIVSDDALTSDGMPVEQESNEQASGLEGFRNLFQ